MPGPFRPRVPRQHPAVTLRPWLPGPDDAPPDDAVPSVLDRCDRCPATARLALRSVQVFIPDGWTRDQAAAVQEIHLCGHHGDRYESVLLDAGWVTIHDSRSALVAQETRS